MIRKLKTKFILLATSALLILLIFIVAGMNVINYHSVVKECDEILSVISQNKGMFPDLGGRPNNKFPPHFSPETPYESRYFSIMMDKNGNIIDTNTSMITSVDANTAVSYAKKALTKGDTLGFIGDYRYIVKDEWNGSRISFLDCGRRLDTFYSFLTISSVMALAGYLIVSVIIIILSGKIIRPIAESYRKQKQFITDAGHEMKTPLTIISANADILEMELGEDNESLMDIIGQAKRLRSLTDDLVMLSRMEEAEESMQKIEFPISDVVEEISHPFIHLAKNEGKELICDIEEELSLKGNEKAIGQLITLLLDNALKYSPAGGVIALTLSKKIRTISLSVYNQTEKEVDPESLKYVFDRFYRTDSSRNSATGGHGIGLSVAKAIVTAHNGEIIAKTTDCHSFQITATFPIQTMPSF